MASTLAGTLGGASALGTRGGDTIDSSNEPDPFQYNQVALANFEDSMCLKNIGYFTSPNPMLLTLPKQSFPTQLGTFEVERMHGLKKDPLPIFYELCKADGISHITWTRQFV